MGQQASLGELVGTVTDGLAAMRQLRDVLWQAGGPALGELFGTLDAVKRQAEATQVAVLAEAMDRGETTNPATTAEKGPTGASGGGHHGWVLRHGPSYTAGGTARLVRVAGAVWSGRVAGFADAVTCGRVGVGNAELILTEMARLEHRLVPAAVPTVWAAYLTLGESGGRAEVLGLRPRLLAEHGADGELQADQDAASRFRGLSQPFADGATFGYRLVLDAEGKAVLEAALGPLAAPRPADGVADLRGSDARRADALIDLVRRAVTAGQSVPVAAKAQLFLTMTLADLVDRVGAGTTVGGLGPGTLLAPDTVRRIACDAGIIPVLLGTAGQILDLGRTARWFTPAQAKALWLRDGGCTFPSCTAPAHWADAHHLWHWADGGPTDLANAALLCGFHHTHVHTQRLTGTVTPTGVAWDTRAGSYDLFLTEKQPGAPPDP